jgi:GDP-mannose transporter
MVGALNKLPVAASGMLFFGDPVTPSSVLAVSVGFFAGLVYAVAKNNQKKVEGRKEPDAVLPLVDRDHGRVQGQGRMETETDRR